MGHNKPVPEGVSKNLGMFWLQLSPNNIDDANGALENP